MLIGMYRGICSSSTTSGLMQIFINYGMIRVGRKITGYRTYAELA